VYRNVELRLRALDGFWPWRFNQRTDETLRLRECRKGRNGVDRGQCEDWRVVILDGCLVRTMVVEHAVRGYVAVDHEFGMSMLLMLVNVLGRSDRQQADGQAQYAREDSGHPHTGNRM
jgi:hypothetical protein